MFPIKDPKLYQVNSLFADHDDYTICSVEPVHHANVKRFSARILLKREVTPEELASINWEIMKSALLIFTRVRWQKNALKEGLQISCSAFLGMT